MVDLKTPPTTLPLTRDSVLRAHQLISPAIHQTPVLTCQTINCLASAPLPATPTHPGEICEFPIYLYFKCENLQKIGAFKIRGATHAVCRLLNSPAAEEVRRTGVVTHSSGNHAQALGLAAREAGIPCTVVMPTISMKSKIAGTRTYGARVVFSGSTAPEREAVVAEVQKENGAVLVPPYDHPDIIVGQGTAAVEFIDQVGAMVGDSGVGLQAIITPCGGGGLLAGTAVACEGTGVRVFGAEPQKDGANDCERGLAIGKRITEVKTLTVADGLRTPVGKWNWAVICDQGKVDGVYSVSEEEILTALRLVLERMKVVVEPSGVVPLAVVLYNRSFRAKVRELWKEEGEVNLGIVFSGGNVPVEKLGELFAEKGIR
ncbi:tryptophan synthase beta subunit-like PLP-dependent enzyme [Terfezia boudieri ATCC MYA-4762]|uniref:Tryptophan synthase beta subunit-like PLP-dependent enzyme n=1 Tax=Terfezia boudieri ATCC MYA-4762 TaxID=1051890 RepID=A0A3N4M1T0_9PEZI|nr:tryptophan synthase beta subunit-like PLP-dependent enzyme [Terfezia boudieri ATCC MYA-4762]